MTRVLVSSSQVIDQLWFVKGINGEMSKCTTKQTDNIGTTPNAKWEKFRRERDPIKPSSKTKCIDKWQKPS